jgi:protein-tyrosine phosphatase
MLREGAVRESEVLEMATVRILFVCTGNTCRSPMAQLLCRKYLSEKFGCAIDDLEKMGYKVYSAGAVGAAGSCASPEVIHICSEKGINADAHRSGTVTCDMLEESDFVFAMTEAHRKMIVQMCPAAANKCILLDSADISDPIGAGIDEYEKCAEQIEKALKNRLGKIL